MKNGNEYILIMVSYFLFVVGFDTRGARQAYALLGFVIVCLGGILKVLLTEAFEEQKIVNVTSLIFFLSGVMIMLYALLPLLHEFTSVIQH